MSFGMQKAQKQQSNVNKQQGQIHKVKEVKGSITRIHYTQWNKMLQGIK